jgi:N-terminal domain of (some) glycogen debranching enzymes
VPPDADLSRALVGKAGDTFFVSAADGGLPLGAGHPLGIFCDDARHLAGHELRVDGERPALAASGEDARGVSWARLRAAGRELRFVRAVLPDGRVEERLRIDGGGPPAEVALALDADFEPMLVLRGYAPPLPAVDVGARPLPDGLELHGRGRDGVLRATAVHATPPPRAVDGRVLRFDAAAGDELRLVYALSADGVPPAAGVPSADAAAMRSDDPQLDLVVERALADLRTLRTVMDGRPYPAAGVPWYVALFGRDSLITSVQALPFIPDAAAGALRLLGGRIGTRTDPVRDEEPGKVLHELRAGELAGLDATFARYHGTVDATPLFLCALAEEARWSGSLALFRELGGAVDAALGWIGDGPLTYRASPGGLRHQGWKDSDDGVPDEHGRQPEDPVALVEAQGYAVAALRAVAGLAERDGDAARAGSMRRRAEGMAGRLERFWLADRRCYAMAVGGDDRAGRALGSNQGHLLWARAVAPARAAAIRDALMGPAMLSGWGLRTLGADEAAYDPVSYHRGSVWPHDTSLFAAGLRAYGFDDDFRRVCDGLIAAAAALPDGRLPELFSGAARRPGEPPEAYGAACRPQAWAAGSVALLLLAALGLEPDGAARRLVVRRPMLPGRARELELRGVPVAGARVDLRFAAAGDRSARVEAHVDGELHVDVIDGD